jgi:hypothetical protein
MKTRITTLLLATLIFALFMPMSPSNANGDQTITLLQIAGVTPPEPGEVPDQVIDETNEYTGTISWESINGPLLGNFETETVYAATIELTLKAGFTFSGVGDDEYQVDGAFKVSNDLNGGLITAFFAPPLLDVTQSLDELFGLESFGEEGSIAIRDIFGDSPIDSSDTVVGPVKIDRIAVDSLNRIVVLASFYEGNNQETEVLDSLGTAIGTGFLNTRNITAQTGNEPGSSAAVEAGRYISNNSGLPFKDWYVPAKDELSALYAQKAAIDGLNEVAIGALNANYWSSSQYSASTAWSQNFLTGTVGSKKKDRELAVRPIRSGTVDNPVVGQPGPGGGKIFYVSDTNFQCGPTLSLTCNYLEAAPANWFSISGNDPSISWSSPTGIDNHILFRLNSNGSYDPEFGDEALYLRRAEADADLKPYALVTTTCSGYTERLDIALDSQDGILVLLSGSAEENTCGGDFHNFVARFTANGVLDSSFGDDLDGAIGTLTSQTPQQNSDVVLFADLTIDAEGRILVASLSEDDSAEMVIERFSQTGAKDLGFGMSGTSLINLFLPDENAWLFYRSISMIANDDGSYIIGFVGSTFISGQDSPVFFTQLLKLEQNGSLDEDFVAQEVFSFDENRFLLPYFFLTDLAPDSETGFIMSATAYPTIGGENDFFEDASSITFRIQMDGSIDTGFLGTPGDPNLSPLYSERCFNSALLRDYLSHRSSDGIIVGNFCDDNEEPGERFKLFSSEGVFQGQYAVNRAPELAELLTNQLIQTRDNKVVVLSGARPISGIFGFMDAYAGFFDQTDWTESRITRYVFSDLTSPPTPAPLTITPSRATVNGQVGVAITPLNFTIAGGTSPYGAPIWDPELPAGLDYVGGQIIGTPTVAGTTSINFLVVDYLDEYASTTIQFVISAESTPGPAPIVFVAPKPIPYLTTLTTPKKNLKDGKLVCTPGTYNAGYTLDGVIQGSTTSLFTPTTFTYNLIINGIAQISLAVTSSSPSNSWDMPSTTSGTLITCSVTVSANGLTNTDRSSDNAAGISAASVTQSNALATANSDYSASLNANSKAYQTTLANNRTSWRSSVVNNRATYLSELNRINTSSPSKETRAQKSAALKIYITTQKQIAVDYKASQPAAATARDAANKAALDAKTAAIAKANATYGSFIESIGYGVLIP